MLTEQVIQRVRALRIEKGWTIHRLAREAEVPDSTIRKMDEPGWNPEIKTLAKLETAMARAEKGAA